MLLSEFIKNKGIFKPLQESNAEEYTKVFGTTTGEQIDRYISIKYGCRECADDDPENMDGYAKTALSMMLPDWVRQADVLATKYTATGGYTIDRTETTETTGERTTTDTSANKAFNDTDFVDDTQDKGRQSDTGSRTTTVQETRTDNDVNALQKFYDIARINLAKSCIFAIVEDLTLPLFISRYNKC